MAIDHPDTMIIQHASHSLPWTVHDVKYEYIPGVQGTVCKHDTVQLHRWIPSSARLVAMGVHPKTTGALQVHDTMQQHHYLHHFLYNVRGDLINIINTQVLQLGAQGLQPTAQTTNPSGIRCGTMHASPLSDRHLATGALDGTLHLWDLERMHPVFSYKQAHNDSINTIDGCGGAGAEV